MERGARAAKVERWTERLERYESSGQTVAEFCREEGIATLGLQRSSAKARSFGTRLIQLRGPCLSPLRN